MNNLDLITLNNDKTLTNPISVFSVDNIKDKNTALQALSFSGSFMTLTAWLRAYQFAKIALYVKPSDIEKNCESVNKSQLYIDIKAGKFLKMVTEKVTDEQGKEKDIKALKTVFNMNNKDFNPKKYTNFTYFVDQVEKKTRKQIKDLSEQDRQNLYKYYNVKLLDELIYLLTVDNARNILTENEFIYDCDLKKIKDFFSGKLLNVDITDEQATDEQATEKKNEKPLEKFVTEQFKKFAKTSDYNSLLDCAKKFLTYVKTLNENG